MCKLGENVSFYIMVKTSAAQFQHDKKNCVSLYIMVKTLAAQFKHDKKNLVDELRHPRGDRCKNHYIIIAKCVFYCLYDRYVSPRYVQRFSNV